MSDAYWWIVLVRPTPNTGTFDRMVLTRPANLALTPDNDAAAVLADVKSDPTLDGWSVSNCDWRLPGLPPI